MSTMSRAQLLLVLVYCGVLVGVVLLFNADAQNAATVFLAWLVASAILGFSLGRWAAAFLPLVAVPIAVPFDYADDYLGSDSPLVWWFVLAVGAIMVLVVLAATASRRLYARRMKSGRTSVV